MKKNNSNKNKKSSISLSVSFMKGSTRYFVLCIIFSLLASLCELICPKIISFTVDSVLGGSDVPWYLAGIAEKLGGIEYISSNLWTVAAAILIVAFFLAIFQYLSQVYNRKGSETLVENMRNKLFSHIERLPSSWFMKNQTGDIIQRCTSDVETVKMFLSEQLTSIISTVLLIVMSLFFMFSISTPLALIALCSIPVIVAYSAVFHKRIGKGFMECDENEGKLSSIAQ